VDYEFKINYFWSWNKQEIILKPRAVKDIHYFGCNEIPTEIQKCVLKEIQFTCLSNQYQSERRSKHCRTGTRDVSTISWGREAPHIPLPAVCGSRRHGRLTPKGRSPWYSYFRRCRLHPQSICTYRSISSSNFIIRANIQHSVPQVNAVSKMHSI
jgi:hypothetical protein